MKIDISIGEAIDRLTILKIKRAMIENEEKLKNISREHELLEGSIIAEYPEIDVKSIGIENHEFTPLLEVNKKLWDVEDKLRLFEKNGDWGIHFVLSARSVYVLNDKRAELKKEINLKYKSELIEEKSYEKY